MKNSKKKQSSKQKRVLVASIVLAGLIVAGGTFAWFTSKDEVTNRLTANSNYGVSVIETFTPPSDWTPGQEVNKDVYAINTGNVDAFVKVDITNSMDITYADGTDTTAPSAGNTAGYVEIKSAKGNNLTNTGITTEWVNEVASIEAGSTIAWAQDSSGNKIESAIGKQTVAVDQNGDASIDPGANGKASFKPTATGLYIFRRSIDGSVDNHTFEYAGYYAIVDDNDGSVKYYEISIPENVTESTDTTGKPISIIDKDGIFTSAPSGITYNKQNTETVTPKFTYDETSKTIVAEYTAVKDNPIKINIKLDNAFATYWEKDTNSTETQYTYMLKHILAAGTQSEKLIDSVTLDSTVSNDAYISFDYDLNVALESAQIVYDTNGVTVLPTAANETFKNAEATVANDNKTVTWTFKTTP